MTSLIARLEAATTPTIEATKQKIREAFKGKPQIVAILKAKEASHDPR